jgi:hypothetical protein
LYRFEFQRYVFIFFYPIFRFVNPKGNKIHHEKKIFSLLLTGKRKIIFIFAFVLGNPGAFLRVSFVKIENRIIKQIL